MNRVVFYNIRSITRIITLHEKNCSTFDGNDILAFSKQCYFKLKLNIIIILNVMKRIKMQIDNKNDLYISNPHCDAKEKYCQSIFTLKYLHVAKLNNKYFKVTNESFQKQSVFLLP